MDSNWLSAYCCPILISYYQRQIEQERERDGGGGVMKYPKLILFSCMSTGWWCISYNWGQLGSFVPGYALASALFHWGLSWRRRSFLGILFSWQITKQVVCLETSDWQVSMSTCISSAQTSHIAQPPTWQKISAAYSNKAMSQRKGHGCVEL